MTIQKEVAANRAARAREDAGTVADLGASLPAAALASIYKDVLAELGAKAGLRPSPRRDPDAIQRTAPEPGDGSTR
jgi:hypothetical protein